MELSEDIKEVSNRCPTSETEEKPDDEDSLETKINNEEDEEDEDILKEIVSESNDSEYSLENQQLAENFYKTQSEIVDYHEIFSESNNEKKYSRNSSEFNETKEEMISNQEAEKKVQKFQYAFITGDIQNISFIERKKMSLWWMIHPSEGQLYHRIHGLTNDVDYSKTF